MCTRETYLKTKKMSVSIVNTLKSLINARLGVEPRPPLKESMRRFCWLFDIKKKKEGIFKNDFDRNIKID